MEPDIIYWNNGKIRRISYFTKTLIRHRENGPAYTEFYENGNKYVEEYFLNGQRHRENGPAYIKFNIKGKKIFESYWVAGRRHNEKGPSIIRYDAYTGFAFEQIFYFNDLERSINYFLVLGYDKNICKKCNKIYFTKGGKRI